MGHSPRFGPPVSGNLPVRVLLRRVTIMSQSSVRVREIEQPDHGVGQGNEWINRKATEQATRAANARQLSGRRRFVDPTTCEREYSEAEMEFMMAMNEYKRKSGRMFPTWSEVLEVLQGLGYEKVAPSVPMGQVDRTVGARGVPADAVAR
jgi:hypothetical protein